MDSNAGGSQTWFTPHCSPAQLCLEMMREWIIHVLKARISRQDFLASLETIVLNQIKRLLNKREMPSIVAETAQEGYRAPFGDHPLLGHIAIYSINLILFRAIVCDEPFVFEETDNHPRRWHKALGSVGPCLSILVFLG